MSADATVEIHDAETFYANAYRRVFLFVLSLFLAGLSAVWFRWGRAPAVGFLAGSAVSILNFLWLKKTVEAFAAAIVHPGVQRRSPRVVGRFLLRYVLIAAVGYVIIKGTANSILGFCSGLFLPVGAILVEAGYEAYLALRRGFST